MTAAEIRTAISTADAAGEPWALLIEHANTRLELHTSARDATVVAHADAVRDLFSGWMLTPDPVPCAAAADAGIELHERCPRCTPPGDD